MLVIKFHSFIQKSLVLKKSMLKMYHRLRPRMPRKRRVWKVTLKPD